MKILVPTRGGESSYPNQDRAIEIAKERGAEIVFLYVTNIEFLEKVARPVTVDVATEIDEMGEFLLAMAQERAAKQGVTADLMVKRGVFSEVLHEVITDDEIGMLILGSSTQDTGMTTREYLDNLRQTLMDDLGVEVILLLNGEIVS